jgi:hypothetical protein
VKRIAGFISWAVIGFGWMAQAFWKRGWRALPFVLLVGGIVAEGVSDREHLEALIAEKSARLQDKIDYTEKLLEEKFRRLESNIVSTEKLLSMAQDAAKEAVNKADEATKTRFSSFNEFNERMNQLARTYLTIPAFEQFRDAMESWKAVTSTRLDRREGESTGVRLTGSTIVALVVALSALLGIIAWFSHTTPVIQLPVK